MNKAIYWLKKLGILRAGKFSAKGDAKEMVDMEIKGELYQSDKEIEAEKKENKTITEAKATKKTAKKNGNMIGKITFGVLVLIGVFFLLAFWGAGWSFWTIVGLLMWLVFLRWLWVHVTSGLFALGKIVCLAVAVVFLSFVFATSDERGEESGVEKESTQKESTKKEKKSSKLAKGVEKDTVAKFLIDLEEETGLDFSKIEEEEVIWTSERVSLKLQKAKSFVAEDLSAKDFDRLEKYFLGFGADTGGVGFNFVPPVGTQSSGFAFRNKEHEGMMCVLVGVGEDGVRIGCGWGPTNNPNSK